MKTSAQKNNNESGFSIVEFLVSTAILSIIAAIAIPNFITFRQNSQLGAATREMFSGFQQAKMTAIKRNINCTITFGQKTGGTEYDYVVYVDANKDFVYDAGEEMIISRVTEKSANIDIKRVGPSFPINANGNPSIAFNSYGLPEDNTGMLSKGTIKVENSSTNRIKHLELTTVGNVKIAS